MRGGMQGALDAVAGVLRRPALCRHREPEVSCCLGLTWKSCEHMTAKGASYLFQEGGGGEAGHAMSTDTYQAAAGGLGGQNSGVTVKAD